MNILKEILSPALIFALLGAVMGLLLAVASKLFFVKKDERIEKVVECLPGANCGGCGYAGCSALAEAIVKGEAKPTACSVTSPENSAKIADIMGLEATATVPMVASLMCSGKCGVAKKKFSYAGANDCVAAEKLGGGDKLCPRGCIGLGTCSVHCPFDAITVEDGIACVDENLCRGCGVCVSHCPKGVLKLVPKSAKVTVGCSSGDPGKIVRTYCEAGCIACKLCEKACEAGAIKLVGNVPVIDYEKCTSCGKCAEKCRRGVLVVK